MGFRVATWQNKDLPLCCSCLAELSTVLSVVLKPIFATATASRSGMSLMIFGISVFCICWSNEVQYFDVFCIYYLCLMKIINSEVFYFSRIFCVWLWNSVYWKLGYLFIHNVSIHPHTRPSNQTDTRLIWGQKQVGNSGPKLTDVHTYLKLLISYKKNPFVDMCKFLQKCRSARIFSTFSMHLTCICQLKDDQPLNINLILTQTLNINLILTQTG